MFNLLPQQEQRAMAREYRVRLATTALAFLAALCCLAFVALLPSLVLSFQKEEIAVKNETTLKNEIASGTETSLSDILKLAGKKVAALGVEKPTPYSYELIGDIIGDRIDGIKIDGISVKNGASENRDVTIKGKAADRETLLLFRRTLEADKTFTDVIVPVSNFAAATNINFSITAKTK